MKKIVFLILLCMSSVYIFYCVDFKNKNTSNMDFIKRVDDKLVVGKDNKEILLRGICFCPSGPSKPNENDYQDVVSMNMNVVRLVLSYRLFYDSHSPNIYRESAWEWLNEHIKLAQKYQVYLILQLIEIEGAQFVPVKDYPFDYRIWEDDQLQNNFTSLWREIADRYKHERQIIGYSLFCEPVCSKTVDQWKKLANKTIKEIRKVDENHIIFIERIYGEDEIRREVSKIELPIDKAFFLVDDENVVYEFYFFERDEYTHQFAPYRPEPELQKSITYPDNNMTIIYQEENGAKETFRFNKEYLEFYLRKQIEFGKKYNVPMFVWSFGGLKNIYENKGGLTWLKDVIDLYNKHDLHYTLWVYRDENFGIFGINDNKEVKKILMKTIK